MNVRSKNASIVVGIFTAFVGCTSHEEIRQEDRIPIHLTTQIEATRGLQETVLTENEKVYVWANKEDIAGSANWDRNPYLKAWTLNSDGEGRLTGNEYYYPINPLSMVAIHGNFSYDEGEDAYPSTVSHTVLTDQNATGNYERSDLLYWGETNVRASASKAINFTHQLSKIEIALSSSYYSDNALDLAEVTLNNIKPTVSMNMADGTLNTTSGTTVTIKPRKVDAKHYEAIIPPQDKPTDFISVKMNDCVVNVDASVSTFDDNKRYSYAINVKEAFDVRLNPLYYMAKNNVKSYASGTKTVTFETNPYVGGSNTVYTWNQAMINFGANHNTTSYDGYHDGDVKDANNVYYHLPTCQEWNSIFGFLAPNTGTTMFSNTFPAPSEAVKEDFCVFGYNSETKEAKQYISYWNSYVASSNQRYAIRFIGTPYCSVWKYVVDASNESAVKLIISARIIPSSDVEGNLATKLAEYMGKNDSWWAENETLGAVQRVIYGAGYNLSGANTTSDTDSGRKGHLISATQNPTLTNNFSAPYFYKDFLSNYPQHGKGYGKTPRLFKNGE